jgi:hypothetical protein
MCCILSVVLNANASYIPGTATLRRIFSPGSHTIRAVYDGTVSEQTSSSSSASLLTVASGAGTPSARSDLWDNGLFRPVILGRFGGYGLLADFNNDGVLNLIVPQLGMQNIGILLWRHNHPRTFLPQIATATVTSGSDNFAVADLTAMGY